MSEEQINQNEKKCKCKIFHILTILALLLSIAACAMSGVLMYDKYSNVQLSASGKNSISQKYDKGRSLKKALDTKKPVIVFFYTDWCGYCQKFAPVFDKITKKSEIKKNFAIAFVNCEDEGNRSYMEEYGIQGFPTVYVLPKEGDKKQLDNGTFFKDDAVDVVSKDALEVIGK